MTDVLSEKGQLLATFLETHARDLRAEGLDDVADEWVMEAHRLRSAVAEPSSQTAPPRRRRASRPQTSLASLRRVVSGLRGLPRRRSKQ